jgi:hypothetical protein
MNNITRLFPTLMLVFATLVFSTGCKKCENEEVTLDVLAYNVAGLPAQISSSKPDLYTSSISPLLNEYNLVHLQEDFCYHDSILLFNNHPYRTETTGCVPGGDGLNTLSDFPIENIYREKWYHCTNADCFTPKGFSFSQITIMGEKVDCYNIHCNAGSSVAAMSARRGNVEQICRYIGLNSADRPALIFGDFNCRYTREGDSIRAFLDLGFKDVWVELVRGGEVPPVSATALTACDPDRSVADCEKVDKVFYRSGGSLSITPVTYKLDDSRYYFQGNDTMPLSDHWPLYTRFNIKKL